MTPHTRHTGGWKSVNDGAMGRCVPIPIHTIELSKFKQTKLAGQPMSAACGHDFANDSLTTEAEPGDILDLRRASVSSDPVRGLRWTRLDAQSLLKIRNSRPMASPAEPEAVQRANTATPWTSSASVGLRAITGLPSAPERPRCQEFASRGHGARDDTHNQHQGALTLPSSPMLPYKDMVPFVGIDLQQRHVYSEHGNDRRAMRRCPPLSMCDVAGGGVHVSIA
jgi:hypothetical protein